ncbi:MAG: hypothetical protein JRH17_16740 [Deltaproteobacteria bacterium]|nr:hypothetical protein [Deltaproteobacteria bacterium]
MSRVSTNSAALSVVGPARRFKDLVLTKRVSGDYSTLRASAMSESAMCCAREAK